jgi:hypothetical protein
MLLYFPLSLLITCDITFLLSCHVCYYLRRSRTMLSQQAIAVTKTLESYVE